MRKSKLSRRQDRANARWELRRVLAHSAEFIRATGKLPVISARYIMPRDGHGSARLSTHILNHADVYWNELL